MFSSYESSTDATLMAVIVLQLVECVAQRVEESQTVQLGQSANVTGAVASS